MSTSDQIGIGDRGSGWKFFGRFVSWRAGRRLLVALALVGTLVAVVYVVEDWRGRRDSNGYELRATVVAVADEIAAAAELVRGKTAGVPVAVVRGLAVSGEGSAQELVMPRERDLFR